MSPPPDASFVDLHRASDGVVVDHVEGSAQRLRENAEPEPVEEGAKLEVGDTVALGPGAEVRAGPYVFRGGNRGRAHALVAPTSFRGSPTRADVPRQLEELARIEQTGGDDPVARDHAPPRAPHERAAAAEFAFTNLTMSAARLLSEAAARSLRSVVLFLSDEAAFVACDAIDAPKLRSLIEHLERPTHVNLVGSEVVDDLLERVYGGGPGTS